MYKNIWTWQKKVYKEKNNLNSADFLALSTEWAHTLSEYGRETCIWCSAPRRSSLVLVPLESGHLSVLVVILRTHLHNRAPKTTIFTTCNFCRKHWFQNLSLGKRLWLYHKELDPCICDDGVSQNYQNLPHEATPPVTVGLHPTGHQHEPFDETNLQETKPSTTWHSYPSMRLKWTNKHFLVLITMV